GGASDGPRRTGSPVPGLAPRGSRVRASTADARPSTSEPPRVRPRPVRAVALASVVRGDVTRQSAVGNLREKGPATATPFADGVSAPERLWPSRKPAAARPMHSNEIAAAVAALG